MSAIDKLRSFAQARVESAEVVIRDGLTYGDVREALVHVREPCDECNGLGQWKGDVSAIVQCWKCYGTGFSNPTPQDVERARVALEAVERLPTLKVRTLEHLAIKQALQRTGGRVIQAAKLVGLGRATLYRRLQEKG